MHARLNLNNGQTKFVKLEEKWEQNLFDAIMPQNIDYDEIDTIDFGYDYVIPKIGDQGYFVIPHGETGARDSIICYFDNKKDYELITDGPVMIMFGVIHKNHSFTAVVTGMTYDYQLVACIEKGRYYIFPRIMINGNAPYEDIGVRYYLIEKYNATYNDIAKAYQLHQQKMGVITSIKQRIKNQPALNYAKDSLFVRVRMGWKPVPPKVLEQTIENEPDMKVACTFEDVGKLMDEFKKQGIDKAEFCLVGWNVKGHDGRWPQIFPVEHALGGKKQLKKLIQKAKQMGYAIVCHTNSTDAYSIADIWDVEDLIEDEQGNVKKDISSWSGGSMYNLCPTIGLEQARRLLPKVAELGFEGLHYIDVISTIKPRNCFNLKHPLSARETIEKLQQIMKISKELFGGFSSEGGYDFAAPYLDFGLYISFGEKNSPMCDEVIPLWQLVYHGFIMSNPYSETVNPTDKDMLKIIEYGARPVIYFNSQFVTPSKKRDNWMGEEDYKCKTEKQRKNSVEKIIKTYNTYEKMAYLQTEYIESHVQIRQKVYEIRYSDNTIIIVDYNNNSFKISRNKK